MDLMLQTRNKGYFLLRLMIEKRFKSLFNQKALDALRRNIDWEETEEAIPELISAFENLLINAVARPQISRREKARQFGQILSGYLRDADDVRVLAATTGVCVGAISEAVSAIQTQNAMQQARMEAQQALLDQGDQAISSIISRWDEYTYAECMAKENDLAVELYNSLNEDLAAWRPALSDELKTALTISSLQEFERRAGQKRKTRAGEDLQQAVELIFDHLGLEFESGSQLIEGTLEADLVVKPNKGYKILVSCKRTGRERVKQIGVDQHDLHRLRFTKVLWFMTEFDQSDNRVHDFGIDGSIFYLPDDNERFQQLCSNPTTAPYVRALSGIRESIKEFYTPHRR